MRKVNLILLLILTLVVLGGCQAAQNPANNTPGNSVPGNNQAPPPPQELPRDYYPLTAGSHWEYEGAGNEYASFTRKVLFAKDNRAQVSEDNGGTVATRVIESTDAYVKVVYVEFEDYQPKNLLETGYTANANDILLAAPVKAGSTWAGTNADKQMIAVDATVDTPAGRFENCIKVKLPGQDNTIYQYYKKGVGLVRQEFIAANGDTVTSTLKKYEIR